MGLIWFVAAAMLCAVGGAAVWLVARRGRGNDGNPCGQAHRTDGENERDRDLQTSMWRHPSAQRSWWETLALGAASTMAPAAPFPEVRPSSVHAHARVIFASTQDGHLVLDCVIIDADGSGVHAPPGLPIALSLGAIQTPWMAVHVEAMLERWARTERIIDLEILDSGLSAKATIVSQSSRLMLPLKGLAGFE